MVLLIAFLIWCDIVIDIFGGRIFLYFPLRKNKKILEQVYFS